MRTGNPPDELEVLLVFRVLRAGYRVALLRLVLCDFYHQWAVGICFYVAHRYDGFIFYSIHPNSTLIV